MDSSVKLRVHETMGAGQQEDVSKKGRCHREANCIPGPSCFALFDEDVSGNVQKSGLRGHICCLRHHLKEDHIEGCHY